MSTAEVPRYLFRAYSPGSGGWNSAQGFESVAKWNNCDDAQMLSDLQYDQARKMLEDHVCWRSNRNPPDDILISFTSSFLFALQHSVRKMRPCWNTTPQDCYICVIDTLKFPPGTFVWTPDLLDQYGLDRTVTPNLAREYHVAEYLVQYELETLRAEEAISVSMSTLIEHGRLYDLIPELDNDRYRDQLVMALSHYRAAWYRKITPLTPLEVDEARNFALCFGGSWTYPMMAWIIAMKARSDKDSLLREAFAGGSYGSVDEHYLYPNELSPPPDELNEVTQWWKIMSVIRRSQTAGLAVESQADSDVSDLIQGLLEARIS
ncbi:hypothetical protein MBLNU459_g6867t1 [Dothideomycetes sp. NU459]